MNRFCFMICGLLAISSGVGGAELNAVTGRTYAPPLKLKDLYGREHALAEYRGQVVLVNFWATWCPPCVREMPSMQALKRRLAHEPFTILAVNIAESPAAIQGFLEKWQINLDILMDPDGVALEAWKVYVFPTSFVVGPKGNIRYSLLGPLEWDDEEVVQKIVSLFP